MAATKIHEAELARFFAERPRDHSSSARAAVAVILAGPGLELALIRRAAHPLDPWSGHMALPGGRRDPADMNLLETARRETREEIGVHLEETQHWGTLPEVATLTGGGVEGMTVLPSVFRIPARPATQLNHEVAEILWVPLESLLYGPYRTEIEHPHQGRILRLPAWNIDGRIVWGLTHRIVSLLLDSQSG